MPTVAYYTVANAAHYAGAVALLNSLRLVGEDAPFYLVDCGLTPSQLAALQGHAIVVPRHKHLHPVLQKATGPLAHPAEIMVILDADVIVTRPLSPLVEAAGSDRIVVLENDRDRYFAEWARLGLGQPMRRRYVACGHIIVPSAVAAEFLPLFAELQEQLEPAETHFGGGRPSSPFFFADQDVLNAMLCTRFDAQVHRFEYRLAPLPPFPGLRVIDADRLRCRYDDGVEPHFLHHAFSKPWLASLKPTVYSELFTRAVSRPDVLVRLRARDVPPRLRKSRLAWIDRRRASLQAEAHSRFRGKLGVRPALMRYWRAVARNL